MTMTYEMNDQNVITSITVNGVTFNCNIQTDGTWTVYLPSIAYNDNDEPVEITVADLNKIDDAYYPIYDIEGNVTNEYTTGEVLENKYQFYWPVSSGYNVIHFWDSASSSYAERGTLYAISYGGYYTTSLPFDTVGICLCVDGKSSSHTQNWTFTTPGTYWYDEVAGTWSTKRND